jgi:hypothetical protein
MGTIYTVSLWNGRDILTKIRGDRCRHLSNITVIFATISDCFMNIGKGVQVMLSFRLRNLRDCNVGVTDVEIYEIRR